MGLFDAFRGSQSAGMYAPWMTYDPGAPQITPSQPMTPAGPLDTSQQSVTLPKGPGFMERMGAADPNTGLSKWQQLQIMGATLRDDPAVAANMQNSMMEQGKLALSNQLARQRMGFTNTIMGQIAGQGGAPAQAPQSIINGQPVPPMPSPGVPQAPGAMPSAPQVGGVPSLPGAHASPLTPAMRKSLAMMAVLDGKPDQAATILDDRKKITAGPDGWMYDQDTGEVIGRLPQHTMQNGFNVDLGAANAPSFIPQLDKGMIPDGRGGVIPIPNFANLLNQSYLATGGAETGRHNLAEEAVARQNAASGAVSASASAQNANTTTANSGNVAPPPGFVIRRPR